MKKTERAAKKPVSYAAKLYLQIYKLEAKPKRTEAEEKALSELWDKLTANAERRDMAGTAYRGADGKVYAPCTERRLRRITRVRGWQLDRKQKLADKGAKAIAQRHSALKSLNVTKAENAECRNEVLLKAVDDHLRTHRTLTTQGQLVQWLRGQQEDVFRAYEANTGNESNLRPLGQTSLYQLTKGAWKSYKKNTVK